MKAPIKNVFRLPLQVAASGSVPVGETAPSCLGPFSLRRDRKAHRAPQADFTLCLLVCAIASWSAPVCGVDRNWTGATSANWSQPSNWSPAGAPQTGDRLIFGAVSDSNRSMVNDITGLSLLGLRFSNNNYQVGGNGVSFTGGIDTDHVLGGSFTISINCPLVFPNGGVIAAIPGTGGAAVGYDNAELDLNGPITVSGGLLQVAAYSYDLGISIRGGNSRIVLQGQIAGAGDILAASEYQNDAQGTIQFNGSQANTFSGTLRLSGTVPALSISWPCCWTSSKTVPFTFNNSGGAVVNSRLEFLSGEPEPFQLTFNQAGQIGANATVAILGGSQVALKGSDQTIGSLVLSNFSADASASTLDTGSTTLAINGGITSSANNQNVNPIIKGHLNINGYEQMYVEGGPVPGLEIAASIAGNGYVKTGNGTLRLSGNNSNFGDIEATAGNIEARTATAFGVSGNPAFGVHLEGGNLTLQGVAIGAQPLFVSPLSQGNSYLYASGQCSWAGPITLNDTFNVAPTLNSGMSLNGIISGTGGLNAGFFAIGSVQLAGPSANTYTGPTHVNGQFLFLAKPTGVLAMAGPLVVGDEGGASEVRWLNAYQATGAQLTLYAQALVNLNNFNEDFHEVTFNGGQVQTGTGQFAIYRPLTVNPASVTAMIIGNLGLPPGGPAVFNVGRGTANSDLALTGVVFGAAPQFVKQGPGSIVMGGSGDNTYTGDTLVNSGYLIIQKAVGTTAIPGHVFIGTGDPTSPAVLLQQSGFNIVGSVTVNGGGFWSLSGAEGFSIPALQGHTPVTLNGGGSVDTGSSGIVYLPVALGIDVNPGTGPGSTISGSIGLDPGAHPFNVTARTGGSGPECTITAKIGQTSTAASPLKTGTGTLVLNAANTYTGATEVSNGTLQIDGAQPQSTCLVDASATLRGSGQVGDIALGQNFDTVAPGDPGSPTSLSCANFNPLSGGAGILSLALNGSGSGTGYSQLDVRTNVNLSGVTLNATLNSPGTQGEQFTIIRNHGGNPVTGTFNGLPEGATLTIGGTLFQITYRGGLGFPVGHDVVLTQISLPPPALTIQWTVPGSVRMLWPTNPAGFNLQSNPGFSPTNWSSVPTQPTVIGKNNVVTATATGAKGFYRLFKP
jgi:fibronectin-binding autotransporter adhesin